MKQALIFSIHSVAGVITNSSSELFVCNTEQTVKDIENMLDVLSGENGSFYSRCGVGSVKVLHGALGMKQLLDEIDNSYLSDGGLQSIVDHFVGSEVDLDVPDYKYEWQIDYTEYARRESQWRQQVLTFIEENRDLFNERADNIVLVQSESDNTIPYELFGVLKSRLNAVRFHLG